jgi:ligand-binding sensor domain-containing protein
VNNGYVFAGTDSGVFVSTDSGVHWIVQDLGLPSPGSPNSIANAFVAVASTVFAATAQGVFFSTNNGLTWSDASGAELLFDHIYAVSAGGGYLYAGTTIGAWRRPLSDFGISAVNEKPNDFPAQLSLLQNYPNPFSGSTNVEYRIPNEEHVTLTVYNSLGKEVATLVNGEISAGAHSVQLYGEGLQNGIYFYRLTAGKNVQTGKMMVLR